MINRFTIVAALCLTATGAAAQTAGDVLEAEGFEGFSNLEQSIGVALLRGGYPEECLEMVPMGTVRQIAALVTSEGDTPEIRSRIDVLLEDACGNLD